MESFYELFVDGSLLDDLIDQQLLIPTTLSWLIISVLGVLVFYYAVAIRPNRSKLPHWFGTLILTSLLVFSVQLSTCFSMQNREIARNPTAKPENITYFFDQGGSVFFVFALEMLALTAILFFLLSIAVKFVGNHNARKTPF
jgi:hypothetical protein